MNVDLDAKLAEARAARNETAAETTRPTATIQGRTFLLPPGGIPADVLFALGRMAKGDVSALWDGFRAMLPPIPERHDDGTAKVDEDGNPIVRDQFAELLDLRIVDAAAPEGRQLNDVEIQVVWGALLSAYGQSAGNLPQPQTSSDDTGAQSKQTSNGTTNSTPATTGVGASVPDAS